MSAYALDFAGVRAADRRIACHVHRTPVKTCQALDDRASECTDSRRSLFLKCENFQRVGAFKFRGSCNAVLNLPPELAARGVVTHSSGNHAQAIALAARMRGIPAHVVMPVNAIATKRLAVAGYGATVVECEATLAAREATANVILGKTGGVLV